MLNALLTASVLAILASILWFALSLRRYLNYLRSEIDEAKAVFREFVSPKAEGQTSPLADWLQAASHAAGRAVAIEVKTTLMGKASGASRLEKAVEGDLMQDGLAEQFPMVGALLDASPSLAKRARKNPGLISILAPFLQNLVASGAGPAHHSSGSNGDRPRFKLGG